MTLTRDVTGYFFAVSKSNASYLAEGRVGLTGRNGEDTNTDGALLRRAFEGGRGPRRFPLILTPASDQLIYSRHNISPRVKISYLNANSEYRGGFAVCQAGCNREWISQAKASRRYQVCKPGVVISPPYSPSRDFITPVSPSISLRRRVHRFLERVDLREVARVVCAEE